MTGRWFQPRRRPADALAVVAFVGYLLLSRVASNLYPLSTYTMYAGIGSAVPSASHVAARDASGDLHELTGFVDWRCPAPLDFDPAPCRPRAAVEPIEYLHDEARAWLTRPPEREGAPREEVTLTLRIWYFDDPTTPHDPVTTEDCALQVCTAVRR